MTVAPLRAIPFMLLCWPIPIHPSLDHPPRAARTQVQSQAQAHLTIEARSVLVDSVAALVERWYVLAEGAGADARELRRRAAAGAFASRPGRQEFAEAVTTHLREITGDAHFLMRVMEAAPGEEEIESPLHHPVRLTRLGEEEHLGFSRLEWLEGGVGYVDIRRVYPLSESKAMVDAAMTFLSGSDAIILDLRRNGGGDGQALQYFASHFFPYPTQLTSYYSRSADFLTELWTTRETATPRRLDVPVFLLVGPETFSAAEILAYDMKVRGRAILVGESTGGGASSVDLFPLGEGLEIYIPTERAVHPVTQASWEGVGVSPDVQVPASAALDTAAVLARAAAGDHGALRAEARAATLEKMESGLARARARFRRREETEALQALESVLEAGGEVGFGGEFFLEVLAYAFPWESDVALRTAILEKRVERFPASSPAWEALAGGYAETGRTEEAVDAFRKALELDPDNRNALKRLRRLTGG